MPNAIHKFLSQSALSSSLFHLLKLAIYASQEATIKEERQKFEADMRCKIQLTELGKSKVVNSDRGRFTGFKAR